MESITFNLRKVNAAFIIKVEFIQNNQMKILSEFQECRELRPFLTKHIPGSCLRSRINTACLGLVHGDDPERCYGEGGGRGVHILGMQVHPWWIHVNVWQNQYSIAK